MSDFKAKTHQIRFSLGLRLRPRWGSLQRSPEPLAVFKGPTSNGRKGNGEEGKGGKGKGRVVEGTGEESWPPQLGSLDPPVKARMDQHCNIGPVLHRSGDTAT